MIRLLVKIQKMSCFWSQEMVNCQILISRQHAWESVSYLGTLQCVHFTETTPLLDSPFYNGLRRFEVLHTKLQDIRKIIKQMFPEIKLIQNDNQKNLIKKIDGAQEEKGGTWASYAQKIEEEINQYHEFLNEHHRNKIVMSAQFYKTVERYCLNYTASKTPEIIQLHNRIQDEQMLTNKCFLVDQQQKKMLIRPLFRISRFHAFSDQYQLVPHLISQYRETYPELHSKIILSVSYPSSSILSSKIDKLLSAYNLDFLNEDTQVWGEEIHSCKVAIQDHKKVEDSSKNIIKQKVDSLINAKEGMQCSYLIYLEAYLLKQILIYQQLSSVSACSYNYLKLKAYIPKNKYDLLTNNSLFQVELLPMQGKPPTKFIMSSLLEYPQKILNTYGVPSSHEFNPAPLYLITFPFFIGVMFGDVGHMLMALPVLILFRQTNPFLWLTLFFMAFCGFLYNQFFGLNFGIFNSCYTIESETIVRIPECVYSLGIDSIWRRSVNQMQFTNSLKMKLSVILGVTHMMLGLVIKIINTISNRKWLQLITVAIPQNLFMITTFVYMDFLIILKWNTQYTSETTRFAPSIISTMIGIFTGFGQSKDPVLWPQQKQVQTIFFVITLILIPIMLLVIPIEACIARRAKNKRIKNQSNELEISQMEFQAEDEAKQKEQVLEINLASSMVIEADRNGEEEEDIKEILVHQFIQTIEFVLGTVSNTASYLRLWALSLAHAQLSEVAFKLLIEGLVLIASGDDQNTEELSTPGIQQILAIILLFISFIAYSSITFGILLCMGLMQCSLHALRLHWVQFQSKFYEGKGIQFKAYNFKSILRQQ